MKRFLAVILLALSFVTVSLAQDSANLFRPTATPPNPPCPYSRLFMNTSNQMALVSCTGTVTVIGSGGGGGSGTVTSVGLSLPSIFSVSGSPVTASGTLTATLATQAVNLVFAGPTSGGAATPTFRALVSADIPSLDAAKIISGTIATARLGSGTANSTTFLRGDQTWAVPTFTLTGVPDAINAVRDYGCVGDDTANDTTCLTNALAAAAATTGKAVYLRAGTYKTTAKLTVPGGVTLYGDGREKTIIHGTANDKILDLTPGTGVFLFRGATVRGLSVRGSSAGANQIGINIDSSPYMEEVDVEDVIVRDTGSHGVYFGNVFSSTFKRIYASAPISGYPFLFNQLNMPGNTFEGLYAQDVNVTNPAGFRIRTGDIHCWGCNGINNSSSNSWWAIIGDKTGIDGATGNASAYFNCWGCNIESSKAGGIWHYSDSTSYLDGRTLFAGDSSGSGTYVALKYEVTTPGSGGLPAAQPKGNLGPLVVFANSPLSFYANSEVIHANDLPPVTIEGDVRQADGAIISSYRNTTNSRSEKIFRLDARMPVTTITANASYTQPGATNYEANCALGCTLTLPFAGYWASMEQLIYIRNIGVGTLVVNGNSGSTMNGGASYSLAAGESVTFIPHSASADYRLVGVGGSGVANRITYWNDVQRVTSSANLTYDGTIVLNQRAGGNPYFAANDTTNGITTRFGPLAGAPDRAIIGTISNHPFGLYANNAERWTIETTGHLTPGAATSYNIGSSSLPINDVTIGGKLYWTGSTVFDFSGSGSPEGVITAGIGSVYRRTNGSTGTTFYIKEAGTGNTGWSALGGAGAGGITTLNGLTTATQSFAVGTSGTDFAVSSATSTHTFNLPDAGASARGVVTTGTQTIAGAKTVTSVFTANPGTTPTTGILVDINALGTTGQRDSNWQVFRGRSYASSTTYLAEWKLFADMTSDTGASKFALQTRINAASFGEVFSVDDTGLVSGGDFSGGTFTAGVGFVGDGASLTNLDASQLITGTVSASRGGAGSISGILKANGAGTVSAVTVGAGLAFDGTTLSASAANPTGTVGLTAVNGSAATYLRSDSAPALSQGISPTWTGFHVFTTTTVAREIDPQTDNTYDLGTTSLRWKTLHVGPGSVVVHNDATNTLKATLGFSSSTAQLVTDSATPLQLKTGSNNGLFFNTNGTIGYNLTSSTSGNVDFRQLANGDTILNARRATDTSPTGNFLNFENAAGTAVMTVDVTGSMTVGTVPVARLSGTLSSGQLPSTAVNSVVNDTNITGSISAQALTLGFTGTLAKARQNAATVYNDAGNTWSTGAQSFASATSLQVPTSAGAAPTANGLIAYDSTANAWKAGVNTASKTFLMTDGSGASLTALNATQLTSGTIPIARGQEVWALADLSDVAGVTGSGTTVVMSTSPTLTTPNLGTPSSVNLANGTNLPISTGISGLGTGVATFLATPTSANLASAITNETGSGQVVFSVSPSLTTPTLGDATANSLTTANTGLKLQDTVGGQSLTVAPGSDLTVNRTLTVTTGDADRTLTLNANATISGTNTGDQTITLTGDVTGSGTGSFAATIANQAVTYAKIQNITDARLLGRSAGSAGSAQEITVGGGLTLSAGVLSATGGGSGTVTNTNTLTANSFVFGDGTTAIKSTAAGATNGQLLIGSTGANPVAAALTGSAAITVTNGAGSITLSVPTSGITNAMLAGSIDDSKLNQIVTADKVADSALTTNVPLLNTTNTFTGGKQSVVLTDSATTTVTDLLDLQHVGGTTSTLFGSGIRFGLESANGTANRHAGNINFQWTTATDASRTAKAVIQLSNNATVADKFTFDGNGDFTAVGNLTGVIANATTGFRVAGAAASGQYLRGNGTNAVFSTLQSADLPATVVRTDQANTFSTGNQDFTSASSFTVPTGAITETTSGRLFYNTTTSNLGYGDAGTARTFANLDETQTFTNKTFSASSNVLGGVTMTLGSDATGDGYARNSSGVLARVPTYNVRSFGAVCDGSTNDATAIQNAINAAVTGGTVSFQGCKTTKVNTQLTVGNGSGTYSTGAGTTSTINDITIDGQGVKITWGGTTTGVFSVNGPVSRVKMRDLFIDMAGSSGIALDLNHPRLSEFSNIYIENNADYGMRLRAYGAATIGDGANSNIFDNVVIGSITAGAKGFDIGHTAICSGCTLDPAQNVFRNLRARFDTGVGTYVSGSIGARLNFMDSSQFDSLITAAVTGLQIATPSGTGGASFPSAVQFNNPALTGTTSFAKDETNFAWTAVDKFGFFNYQLGDTETLPSDVTNTYGFDARGGSWGLRSMAFEGTGRRITADFSNATFTNRLMFQSSTTNGSTYVSTLPNGTDTSSGFVSYANASPTSSHYVRMFMNGTFNAFIDSGKNGGGAVAPLGFAHNAAQIATFTTGGHFAIGAGGTADAGFLTVAGNIATAVTSVSANTTLNDTHSTLLCDASGAARTMTLPASSGLTGRVYTLKKTDSSANACIFDGNASETIDGSLTVSVSGQNDTLTIQSDGTNWRKIGSMLNSAGNGGQISGLILEWVSTTQVRVGSGIAQIEATKQILSIPSALTVSPSLSTSAWHHCYVYDNSGVGALECNTTAPATPWVGYARSKTSDTTRRYVGSFRTNGSTQIVNFATFGGGSEINVRYRNAVDLENRILSNRSDTTNATISASTYVPVTAQQIHVRATNLATSGFVYFDSGELNPAAGQGHYGLGTNSVDGAYLLLDTSQQFRFAYSSTPSGSNFLYMDVVGYLAFR